MKEKYQEKPEHEVNANRNNNEIVFLKNSDHFVFVSRRFDSCSQRHWPTQKRKIRYRIIYFFRKLKFFGFRLMAERFPVNFFFVQRNREKVYSWLFYENRHLDSLNAHNTLLKFVTLIHSHKHTRMMINCCF